MAIGGAGAFVTVVLLFVPPAVELAWIDSNNGFPVASRLPSERWMPIPIVDLYRHRARLPLQLGIRNRWWLPLSEVAVTIEYPRVAVESAAAPLASEDSSVIMQHTVGLLLPGRTFRPLGDTDQVLVPVDSLLSGAITVDGAGIPQYVEFTKEWPQRADTSHVELSVVARVSAAGRLRQCVQQLEMPIWLEQQSWWPPPIPMKERAATEDERRLFASLFQDDVGDTVFGGAMSTKKTPRRVRWTCVKSGVGRFTKFSIDGVPIRLQADTDGDWLVDFELLARPSGGGRITRTDYGQSRPMDMPFVPAALRPALPGESVVPGFPARLRN